MLWMEITRLKAPIPPIVDLVEAPTTILSYLSVSPWDHALESETRYSRSIAFKWRSYEGSTKARPHRTILCCKPNHISTFHRRLSSRKLPSITVDNEQKRSLGTTFAHQVLWLRVQNPGALIIQILCFWRSEAFASLASYWNGIRLKSAIVEYETENKVYGCHS